MATEKYVCRECDRVEEFDSRRKKHTCWLCGKEMHYFSGGGVVGKGYYRQHLNSSVSSVAVPEGVMSLEERVFWVNDHLKTVILPESLTSISEKAFSCSDGLTLVNIPKGVKYIYGEAFSLTLFSDIYIPETVEFIGDECFHCKNPMPMFHVVENSYAHNYVVAYKLEFKLQEKINGAAIKDDVVIADGIERVPGHILEYTDVKTLTISSTVKTIEEYAFADCESLTEIELSEGIEIIGESAFSVNKKTDLIKSITIPESVKEIAKNAFAGRALREIIIKPGVKTIAAGAFSDAVIGMIDLPETVEEVAPGAFGNNTIVSIGGVATEIIAKKHDNESIDNVETEAIDDLNKKIKQTTDLFEEKRRSIDNYDKLVKENETLLSEEQKKLEEYSRALDDAAQSEADLFASLESSLSDLRVELQTLNDEAGSLNTELSHTFFLNVSKRNALKSKIEIKENEIRQQEEKISNAVSVSKAKTEIAANHTASAKAEKNKSETRCSELEKESSELKARKSELEAEASELSDALSKLQNELEKAEVEHEENSKKREKELKELEADIKAKRETKEKELAEEERIYKLEAEKAEIVSIFDADKIPKETAKLPERKNNGPNEKSINDQYEKFIVFQSEQNRCKSAKELVDSNKSKLNRLKAINRELGKEENDGIDPVFLNKVPKNRSFLPEKTAEHCNLFAGFKPWKQLKNSLIKYKYDYGYKRIMGDNDLHREFLESSGGVPFCFYDCLYDLDEDEINIDKDNCILYFTPLCIIRFDDCSDMDRYFYNAASVSLEHETFESEEELYTYEEIGNRYLHENKDGTKNLRFSHNPLIHIYKRPILYIEFSDDLIYSTVISDNAEQLADDLRAYVDFLTTGPYTAVYDAVLAHDSVEEIRQKIEEANAEYERQKQDDKEKRAAEKKAKKDAEKREEAERLEKLKAAEKEAAEKRKALIAKQRERNEEKRFDEIEVSETNAADHAVAEYTTYDKRPEETAAALSVVPSVAGIIQSADFAGNVASEKGLILSDKNRTVHNNIFSLNFVLKGKEDVRNVFMTDRFGTVISNVKDITAKAGEKIRVSLTLRQIDFDKNGKYYLAVTDGKGRVESLTAFKIDIAFSNDFEDDFGSSFDFESFDDSAAYDKVEIIDEEIPEETGIPVSSEKVNETDYSHEKTEKETKKENKMDFSCTVDSISQWKVDEKLISIPKNAVTLPDDTYFKRLDYSVVEIPKAIWDSDDFDDKYMEDPKGIPNYDKSADIVFKVLLPDDTYYYAFFSYQDCYGEYNYYRQTPDNDEFYSDDSIDEELLRHYATDFNPGLKVIARLCRVASPYKLDEELNIKFVSYIKKYALKTIEFISGFDCPELIETLYRIGALKQEQNGTVLEALNKKKASKCIADFDRISSAEAVKLAKPATQKKPARTKGTVLSFTSDFSADHPGLALKKSMKRTPIQVMLSTGRKFTYLCRFPVSNEDQVIIGNGYGSLEPSKNSGLSGSVTDCEYPTAPKKAYAVEISFAFSRNAQNIDLKECGKMFEAPSADEINSNVGYYGKLYPITHEVRKMLSALTVLDYSDYTECYMNSAKLFINSRHVLSDDIEKMLDTDSEISISDMKSSRLQKITAAFASKVNGAENGFIVWEKLQESKDEFKDFFHQYVLFGTADIIIRCDLDNLLKVYLENCREINEQRDALIEMARELGAEKCLELLN